MAGNNQTDGTGLSKTDYEAHETENYQSKTGSTRNTNTGTQNDRTKATEGGERKRGRKEGERANKQTCIDITRETGRYTT